MAWNDIPEFHSASSSQDDNPIIGSRASQTRKVSVKVPVDEWLCRKFEKLNLTVQEGYRCWFVQRSIYQATQDTQVVWDAH